MAKNEAKTYKTCTLAEIMDSSTNQPNTREEANFVKIYFLKTGNVFIRVKERHTGDCQTNWAGHKNELTTYPLHNTLMHANDLKNEPIRNGM
jgi:hypothetical protein